jgi:hypothetical protein
MGNNATNIKIKMQKKNKKGKQNPSPPKNPT